MYVADVVCLRQGISNVHSSCVIEALVTSNTICDIMYVLRDNECTCIEALHVMAYMLHDVCDWCTICRCNKWLLIIIYEIMYILSCCLRRDMTVFPIRLWLRHGPYNTLESICLRHCHGMYVADVVCLRQGISNSSLIEAVLIYWGYMWGHVHFILCVRRDNDSVSQLLCDWGMAHTIHWGRYVFEAPYTLHVMACMLLTWCVWGLATVHSDDWGTICMMHWDKWLRLPIYYMWDHVHFILCVRRDNDSVSQLLCDWGMAHTIHWGRYVFEAPYLPIYYMWDHAHFILMCLRRDIDSVSHSLCDWGMAHTIHWGQYMFEALYTLHVMACMLLTWCVWGEALATVHSSCVIEALSVWCTGTNVWLRLLKYYMWYHVHFILLCLRRDNDSVSHLLCDWGMAHTIHWSRYVFEAPYILHVMACICCWRGVFEARH